MSHRLPPARELGRHGRMHQTSLRDAVGRAAGTARRPERDGPSPQEASNRCVLLLRLPGLAPHVEVEDSDSAVGETRYLCSVKSGSDSALENEGMIQPHPRDYVAVPALGAPAYSRTKAAATNPMAAPAIRPRKDMSLS